MRRAHIGQLALTRRSLAAGVICTAFASMLPPAVFAGDDLTVAQFRDEVVEVLRRDRPNLLLKLSEEIQPL